ncbi:MAG TPA: VWA domain-containing protein [Thermoanaerobaculia bacterium]
MRRFMTLAILCLTLPMSAQQPGFGERVEVNAVLLDVVVTDRNGNQILGLTKDDFVVKENGARQTIDSVDYVTSRRLINDREEKLPFDVERVREERFLIFFFDKPDGGGMFDQISRARSSVSRFLDDDMGATDYVALVGHDVRLKVYTDFTNDKNRLRRALREVALFSNGETKPTNAANAPSILREIDTREMINNTGTVYEAIDLLADSLRNIRGRKNLVLFSPGIREPGETVRNGMLLNESRYYQPMIDSLNASNVTVYGANLIQNAPPDPVFHQTLQRMSDETSGEYFRQVVTFDPVIDRVEKATGGYYLITYRTEKPRGSRGFQKVDVDISNPEFEVKARPGYLYGDK